MAAECEDCGERTATTVRDNDPVCDQCAADWDGPVEIHEPTIARVRRDVEQYKCQPAWLDAWSMLQMFDRLRAELERSEPVVEAARALVEQANQSNWVQDDIREYWPPLADALAALAASVAAHREGETDG